MESMERIDVLKGIEQILVQKAYETGHISHRADGDWQKQADGSWIPYKGQSSQSAPQAQENSPTKDTEHTKIVQQDFESVPNSVKDKMFTIAQQYKAEWAEDSDEDIRSMAEDDVEAISQMLWDNADEETRNSWIGSEDSNKEDQYGEPTEEDLVETPIKNKLSKEEKSDINNKLYDVLSFYDSDAKELFGMNRTNNGELDGSPSISYDWRTDKILPADKDKFDKVVRHYMDKAGVEDTPLNYKQAYSTIKGMAINNGMLKRTNHPLDSDEDLIETEDFSPEEYNDFKSEIESLASGEFFNDVANIRVDPNNSDMPDNDDLMEVTDKLIEQFDLSKNLTDEQYEDLTEVVQDIWSQNNPNVNEEDSDYVQKSAVRDMRSTPTVKNMGF